MIPEEKKILVEKALQTAFGVSNYDDVELITIGLSSAIILRVVVLGRSYLLRIITQTDDVSDPGKWYNCMIAASEAGIAPHVWYTSVEDRISITDFVEVKPFPVTDAAKKMPVLLKRLHALPPFPQRLNYFEFVDGIVSKFQEANVIDNSMTRQLIDCYAKIRRSYKSDSSDMVACHNDLKPENIIYDGAQPWLVDWEAVFLNDRYVDLAIVANFVIDNYVEEKAYLKQYFGSEPNKDQLARFFLVRQILHMSYFVFFMLMLIRSNEPIDMDAPLPGFREFHERMWKGEIDLNDNHKKLQYARVHMLQLQHNFKQERFEQSLRVVDASWLKIADR